MDRNILEELITKVILETVEEIINTDMGIPAGISVRHIHIQKEHLEKLFGTNYKLTHFKDLSQIGQFAAEEKVDLIGPKGEIKNVRILGPERPKTQVELALSDARILGIKPPVRASGDLENSEGIIIRGPLGEVQLNDGVIIAERHIHMSDIEAKKFNVVDGEKVQVQVTGDKPGIFDNVTIRVNEKSVLDFHIDTDDANAFLLNQGSLVQMLKKS